MNRMEMEAFCWEGPGRSIHLVMSRYDWLFLTMQFTSNGSQTDDASETKPILSKSTRMSSSKEALSLCEIRPFNADADDDLQSIDADEHCSLVNAEQPQCWICFDSEGYFLAQLVYYFPPGIYSWVVAFPGMLIYKFYGNEPREMFGYEQHPYGFYSMPVLAITLVSLLYGFFIAIICGQRISERHYHVLA